MPLAASDVTPVIGHGVQGVIEGQALPHRQCTLARTGARRECRSGLTIYLADEHGLLARFILADTLRPDAGALIRAFKEAGLQTTILTGDGSDQADMLARELGVDELVKGSPWTASWLSQGPEAAGDISIMVGDGINDAPVLAARVLCHGRGWIWPRTVPTPSCWPTISPVCWPPGPWPCALARSSNFAGPSAATCLCCRWRWCSSPYLAAAGMSLAPIVVTSSMRLNR